MTIVLSHISALECLNSNQQKCHLTTQHARSLISQPPQVNIDAMKTLGITLPVQVLVLDELTRRNSKDVICHTWRHKLPKDFVQRIDEGLYSVSPELAFVQAANSLTLIDAIILGYELCGTYRAAEGKLFRRSPLTNRKKLATFVEKASYVQGSKKAKRALHYVLDNSASPMETALTMLLCLPYKLGGYGFPYPLLNHQINSRNISTKTSCYICDLYWSQVKLAIEYDSTEHHTDTERITKDSIRRDELFLSGVNTITVTRDRIKNRTEMDKVADSLAILFSKRIRLREPAFSKNNSTLRNHVFNKTIL